MSDMWSDLGAEALEIADPIMDANERLEQSASRLQALILRASNTQADDEDMQQETLKIWLSTFDEVMASLNRLTGRGGQ